MSDRTYRLLKVLTPIGILVLAGIGAYALANMRDQPETRRVEVPPPAVRVATVDLRDLELEVHSQGTVQPRTESRIVPEVPGRVIEVSPAFVDGGFFEPGQMLLRLDRADYEQALVRARAEVAAAKLRLAQEEAEARLARKEWEALGEGGAAPDLTLRLPQLENAHAGVAAAEAALTRAERDLERTAIRAPYAGRVRDKIVDVGQYVTPGTMLGTVYAIDLAEVRLPLPDDQLAFLDLALAYRGEAGARGPRVVLSADFAGREFEWEGRIVRTEGEVDAQTRMVHVVAAVTDPYGRGADPERPPLAVGMFVQARIEGRTVNGVAALPREALRPGDRMLVAGPDERLRIRQVEVVRTTREQVIVGAGLEQGDRVVLTDLPAPVEGMSVRVAEELER